MIDVITSADEAGEGAATDPSTALAEVMTDVITSLPDEDG